VNASVYASYLIQKQNPGVVRHFGFHLLEHLIKYKWNGLSNDQRNEIKKASLELLATVTIADVNVIIIGNQRFI
jgi:hypothetical protein